MKNYTYWPKKRLLITDGGLVLDEVSTKRQAKNGTLVFELNTINSRTVLGRKLLFKSREEFGVYEKGYVRRLTNRMYPINKRKVLKITSKIVHERPDGSVAYSYVSGTYNQSRVILLEKLEDRLQVLSRYLDKKYENTEIALNKNIK